MLPPAIVDEFAAVDGAVAVVKEKRAKQVACNSQITMSHAPQIAGHASHAALDASIEYLGRRKWICRPGECHMKAEGIARRVVAADRVSRQHPETKHGLPLDRVR